MIVEFALIFFLSLCSNISPRTTHKRRDDMRRMHHQSPRDITMAEVSTVSKRGLLNLPFNRGNAGGSGSGPLSGLLQGVPSYDPCNQNGPIPPSAPGDAPFTQGITSLIEAIVCPAGTNAPRGLVLAVPCTACGGEETFARSMYGTELPGLGYAVCWLEMPGRSTGDIQVSGEFVAFAIKYLAERSPEGSVNVLTYSQGGLITQYVIESWPSLRRSIKQAIFIAAPLKGTSVASIACEGLGVAGGCSPALYQMSSGSRFIKAVNSLVDEDSGAQAQVPTTSLFTLADELVVPQSNDPSGSSYLEGAVNIAIQEVCPTTAGVEHFQMISARAVYGLVLEALEHGRPTRLNNFDRKFCGNAVEGVVEFAGGLYHNLELTFRGVLGNAPDRLSALTDTLTTGETPTEPYLQPHLCARGYADANECVSQPGFCEKKPSESVLGGKTLPNALSSVKNVLGHSPLSQATSSVPVAKGLLKGILAR